LESKFGFIKDNKMKNAKNAKVKMQNDNVEFKIKKNQKNNFNF